VSAALTEAGGGRGLENFSHPRVTAPAPAAAERFRGFRSAQGEEMILQKNIMIEGNLALAVHSGLAEADLDVYRAPFLEPASRTPMLAWTREFPLDGEPADVAETVRAYGRWMSATPDGPKLLMTVKDSVGLGSPEMISWAAETSPPPRWCRSDRVAINYLLNLRRGSSAESQVLSFEEFRDGLADGLADADYQGPEAQVLADEMRLTWLTPTRSSAARGGYRQRSPWRAQGIGEGHRTPPTGVRSGQPPPRVRRRRGG
jgi:hypothetical protein